MNIQKHGDFKKYISVYLYGILMSLGTYDEKQIQRERVQRVTNHGNRVKVVFKYDKILPNLSSIF